MIFCSLTTAWFACFFEWGHYRQFIDALGVRISTGDRVVVIWLLWWKSVVLFVPVLCICGLLAWQRCLRWAKAVLMIGWVAIMSWLVADLRLQQVVGSHAFDYLPYVYDALAMPLDANHTEWSGDNTGIFVGAALVLLFAVLAGQLLWRGCDEATRRWICRWPGLSGPFGWLWGTALLFLALAGFVPAQGSVSSSLLLRPVQTAIPVDVTWLNRLTAATRWVFGQEPSTTPHWGEAGPAVRIVSLLPNPAGADSGREEVHLHNFTGQTVELDGWWMQDGARNAYALAGPITPSQTRVVTLPPGAMPLNNAGDRVQLYDAVGTRIHEVSYHRQEAKYGGVVNFRDAGDYDAFEWQVNAEAVTAYQSMHERITSARDVDRTATFDRPNPPNVIYLVLESFRHTAISPQVMAKLHAWSQRGLRLCRHYAGSNASHLGLFTLLYGRSPLAYEPCLDAKVPPQTVYSLKESGYECFFLTAGDCRGFRRMGEFLSEDFFDRVSTDRGETWLDRVDRDRRTLARVNQLASESSKRPRFIMAFLMSTHFPYTFPEEFNHHQPSGDDVSYVNWKQTDRTVLYNRYKNAALFLEDEMVKLIDGLDGDGNVVLVTGDHGESMSEDGALAHGSRGSEIQTRVPCVMVGPGVPARRIEQPTTHADVLPTLLHVLAGRPVPLKHTHGRDMLGDAEPSDRVLICPYRWKAPYDLILIRGAQRLQFKFRSDRPEIQVVGFCDEAAKLCFPKDQDVSPRAAKAWAEALRQELSRITR